MHLKPTCECTTACGAYGTRNSAIAEQIGEALLYNVERLFGTVRAGDILGNGVAARNDFGNDLPDTAYAQRAK